MSHHPILIWQLNVFLARRFKYMFSLSEDCVLRDLDRETEDTASHRVRRNGALWKSSVSLNDNNFAGSCSRADDFDVKLPSFLRHNTVKYFQFHYFRSNPLGWASISLRTWELLWIFRRRRLRISFILQNTDMVISVTSTHRTAKERQTRNLEYGCYGSFKLCPVRKPPVLPML